MKNHLSDKPLNWVTRFAPLISPGGSVLDLACGNGRHSFFLAERGFSVTAVDRNITAISNSELSGQVEVVEADLEDGSPWPLAGRQFDGIVVTHYLHRPLFPTILASLGEGGVLIYETFSLGNEDFGRPSHPDFLLKPGELLNICSERLRIVAYEEGLENNPGPAVKQRLCAINRPQVGKPTII